MRIAYVANIRLPTEKAHGLQIMEMCRAFARNGHRVRLIVPERAASNPETPWAFYGIEPDFEIVRVPILDFIRFDRLLGRAGLWLNTLQFLLRARRVVRAFAPDVVYAREAWYSGLAPEAPAIFEAHDFPERVTPLHRRSWKKVSRIVAVTAGLKKAFLAHGVPEEKVLVAHDAVDEATFAVRETKAEARALLGLPKDRFLAVYTGHLYPYKGADDLLEAASETRAHIVFVGGRPDDLARLKVRAQVLGLANVTFVGQVPHRLVPTYLRAADAAVLPTRGTDRHASEFLSPLKLFEYLAAGKALIATNLPSAREVLNADSAVLVPPSDPHALAAALNALAASPERVVALEGGSTRLSKAHTWTQRAKDVIAALPEAPRAEPWYGRYRLEALCALLAFAIRAVYVVFFPQLPTAGGDAETYLRVSEYVLGRAGTLPESMQFFPVLYPHFLALVRWVFGDALVWVRLMQAALASGTVFIAAWAARRWLGRKAGLMMGVLAAVYAPLVLETGTLYTETLYASLLTPAVLLGGLAVQERRLRFAAASGAAFMLAGLTRELAFYQAMLFAAWSFLSRRSWKIAAALAIPTLLALAVLQFRNAAVAREHALPSAPLASKQYERAFFEPTLAEFLFSPSRWHLYPEGSYLYWRFPYRLSNLGSGEPVDDKAQPQGDVVYHLDWKRGSFMAVQPMHQVIVKWLLVLTHWSILLFAVFGLWRGALPKEAKAACLIAILFAWGTIMFGGLHRIQGFEGFEPLARYRFPTDMLILLLAVSGAHAIDLRRAKT